MLNAVACTRGSCVAVGSVGFRALLERWNGRSWSIQGNPSRAPEASLNGVSCVSVAECTAVGDQTNSTHKAVAERWSGSHWSIERTPTIASGSILWSVSCISAADCVAAGASAGAALIERSTGTTWSIQSIAQPPL